MSQAVLFYKQLGDLVLLQPALARMAASDGKPVAVMTHAAFAPILELFGKQVAVAEPPLNLADLYVFEKGSRPAWKAWKTRALRKHLFLSKDAEKKWFHPWIFDRVVVDPAWKEYRAHYYWKNVPGKSDDVFSPPRLQLPPPEWKGRHAGVEGRVLIHPTAAWKRKCWTARQWHESMALLHAEGVESFVITSGPDAWEVEHARDVAAGLPGRVTCLAGETSLRELIGLVAASRLVLAVDGAVAHLAAALKKPSVVLFGPASPLHWHHSTAMNKVLSARDYCGETRPPAERIPAPDLAKEASRLCRQESES